LWTLIARAAVLLITLPVHEYAHAYTAVKLGDPTPENQKRLTLNPFAHLDIFGSMMLLILGFGWAKPVMVDARNFKHPRRDMAITAVAGPLANVLMAFILLIVYKIIFFTIGINSVQMDAVLQVLGFMVRINLTLAVFNLLPIPPLDGSKVLGLFLPDRIYAYFVRYERIVMIVIFILLWFGFLSKPITFLSGKMLDVLLFITRPIDMLLG
jgi:Zn-dependent protease